MSYDIEYCRKYEPIFGSWYIKRKLGEGNYGAVFEIEREDFGTKYHAALKIVSIPKNRSELENLINDSFDASATEKYIEHIVEKIVKEFELMAKLKGNSNVVSYEDHQVIKHSDDAGCDVLIRMELLTPLLAHFKSKEVTRRDIVKLGIDICNALELCKENNIIHRDIKPENIFVSQRGDYKLGDFGIAKQVDSSQAELTKIGTPTYMAPEVVKGYEYDASVDMYSLGVVMYRFLNHNRTPFMPAYPAAASYADKDKAFGIRINSGKSFPYPTNAGSRMLANILLKACSYNPAERFSSPVQMRRLLQRVLDGEKREILDIPVISAGGEQLDAKNRQNVTPQASSKNNAPANTRMRYAVPAGDTCIFDNVTGKIVVLSRLDDKPIDVEIIKPDGKRSVFTSWTQNKIELAVGDKVQITNVNNTEVVFCRGAQTSPAKRTPISASTPKVVAAPKSDSTETETKPAISLLLILIVAVLAVLLCAGIGFLLFLLFSFPEIGGLVFNITI